MEFRRVLFRSWRADGRGGRWADYLGQQGGAQGVSRSEPRPHLDGGGRSSPELSGATPICSGKRDQRALCRSVPFTRWFCSRSEEHTSELQSLMRISYAVFCLKTKTNN